MLVLDICILRQFRVPTGTQMRLNGATKGTGLL